MPSQLSPFRARCSAAIFVHLLVASNLFGADVRVLLPLDGQFHPGRFMPLHVIATGVHGGALTLWAPGAVPLRLVASNGSVDLLAPWLVVGGSVTEARASDDSKDQPLELPLQALGDDQKLIALSGIDAAEAPALFGEEGLRTIRLDLTQTPLAPTAAFESLDGLVLDPASAARVDEEQLGALLSAGTTVAIRSDSRPAGQWPWKQEHMFWVLRPRPIGPRGSLEPRAYEPTYAWTRGWPAAVRRQATLIAVVFVLLVLAVSLWRSRWALVAVVATSLVQCALCLVWFGRQPVMLSQTGAVAVVGQSMTQEDRWSWYSPLREADGFVDAEALDKPIFASAAQIQSTAIRLDWSAGASRRGFAFRLAPRTSLAFLDRSTTPGSLAAPRSIARSTLASMARELYLGKSLEVLGEHDAEGEPTVFVGPSAP